MLSPIEEMLRRMEDISLRETRSLLALALKSAEETGELAEEVLIATGESPSKSPGPDGVLGESVDLLLMAISIFFKYGGSMDELVDISHKKMDKWEENMSLRQGK